MLIIEKHFPELLENCSKVSETSLVKKISRATFKKQERLKKNAFQTPTKIDVNDAFKCTGAK